MSSNSRLQTPLRSILMFNSFGPKVVTVHEFARTLVVIYLAYKSPDRLHAVQSENQSGIRNTLM